jgi:hypothetical protein
MDASCETRLGLRPAAATARLFDGVPDAAAAPSATAARAMAPTATAALTIAVGLRIPFLLAL